MSINLLHNAKFIIASATCVISIIIDAPGVYKNKSIANIAILVLIIINCILISD